MIMQEVKRGGTYCAMNLNHMIDLSPNLTVAPSSLHHIVTFLSCTAFMMLRNTIAAATRPVFSQSVVRIFPPFRPMFSTSSF